MKSKKVAVISKECVACGCCVKVCPLGALLIDRGLSAVVAEEKCVGCGKCVAACPAQVISVRQKENLHEEQSCQAVV